MPLAFLVPSAAPADFDVQGTAFTYDVMGRYVCNNWAEVGASQAAGAYPFDAVVIGAGMFGGYCAEKLFRLGTAQALRVLVIDAGAYLFPSHIQNLPKQLGGKIGGADNLRNSDTGTQNVVWGMPWVSNEGFPGLAYCIGGRSLFWGGWSPRLTAADLVSWPAAIRDSFTVVPPGGDSEYGVTEKEIGVDPSTDYIVKANLYNALLGAFTAVPTPGVTEVTEAPLAVQGSSPGSGLFAFDKFSSVPFLVDAIRTDSAVNGHHGDVSRRISCSPARRSSGSTPPGPRSPAWPSSPTGSRRPSSSRLVAPWSSQTARSRPPAWCCRRSRSAPPRLARRGWGTSWRTCGATSPCASSALRWAWDRPAPPSWRRWR